MTRDLNSYQIWVLGQEARKAGIPANECPFAFNRSAFWPSNYAGFNAVRWKLDAWMKGWMGAQNEETKT